MPGRCGANSRDPVSGRARRLAGTEFKSESERIQKAYKEQESRAYGELSAFAASRHFALHREGERLVFTMLDERGQAMLEDKVLAMPLERKAALEQAEQELRAEIARFFEKIRPREKAMNEALAELRRRTVSTLLEEQLQNIRAAMEQEGQDGTKLNGFFLQLSQDVLNHVELFEESDADEEGRLEELNKLLARYRVNLLVDNGGLSGAPALVENNPLFRSLYGSIEYQVENDVLVPGA